MNAAARDVAAAVSRGETSARAVAEAALARVERDNPALNVFAHLDPALSLAEADAVDRRLAAGDPLPLAGVPVVVKDNIWTAGRIVTQGSRLFAQFRPERDAVAVARLRRAGAVILGMGTCSEFACKGVTTTPLHGTTRNPIDPALTPGGSSGGPAAAIAAGFAPLALGTDAGGSSRRPPAHVGIVGLKPSQDAIPYGPGFAEPSWNISVLAPMARDVADTALMFDVLLPGASPDTDRPMTIALAPSMGLNVAMDAEVADAISQAADILRRDGHEVRDVAPVWPDGTDPSAMMALQWAGLAALYGAEWQARPEMFDPDIGSQIEAGLALSGVDVARALESGRATRDVLRAILSDHDLIVSATTPCPAWPLERLGPETIGGRPAGPRDHAAFTPQFNHAGLPAISIPCGVTKKGFPLGLQIGAGMGRDRLLLGVALRAETSFRRAGLTPHLPASNE